MGIKTPQAQPGSSLPERIGKTLLVQMTAAVYAAIRAHGEETYPNECCGVLLGRISSGSRREGWRIEAAVRAGNARADAAHNRYEIAPAELVNIEHEARGLRMEIAGFYHSHPDHAAHWSLTDLAEAHWLGCCYVITSVAQGRATETSFFLLAGENEEEKHFEEQAIQVDDESIDQDQALSRLREISDSGQNTRKTSLRG
jgi:proteasome lid subunit RPN8/RPN11